MNKKHEIIKAKVDNAYERIKDAEKVLEDMREHCEHPETELCTYSPRPGQHFENTKICSVCGGVISFAENPQKEIWTITGHVDEDTPVVWENEGFVHKGIYPWKNKHQKEIDSWNDGGVSTGMNEDD
jgi:hypothetical protein